MRAGEGHSKEQSDVPISLLSGPPCHRHALVLLPPACMHPCSLQAPRPFVGGVYDVGTVTLLLSRLVG